MHLYFLWKISKEELCSVFLMLRRYFSCTLCLWYLTLALVLLLFDLIFWFFKQFLSFVQSKYIAQLKEKAEQRKREQDIIYERKLQKERSKEDHLFGDKDKFVTSAYRKKLEEQQKWLEEERIRQLREEREDVSFLSLFAFAFHIFYTYIAIFMSSYFYYFFLLFPSCMFASSLYFDMIMYGYSLLATDDALFTRQASSFCWITHLCWMVASFLLSLAFNDKSSSV